METPASMNLDATIDHLRDSLPPNLIDGLKIAAESTDGEQNKRLIQWLARHPSLAGELAQFLADEFQLKGQLELATRDVSTGSVVGKYELRQVIGHGAMGVVYRAYDPELKREVAIKRVKSSFLSPQELARFRREAELAASLQHPNVVRVLDYGETHESPFLVMELMERSLADRLKSLGPDRLLSWKEAAQIVHDAALGMQDAHQHALIHRDLKPANILLDRENRPHVADFGLARQLDESMTTGIAGTFAYMAPEQARGEKVLTTAVDIHSLGAILFELLMGEPPFGTRDVPTVVQRLKEEPPPRIREVRPDVPDDLERICQRCLSKQAADRYPSAQALADDLQRVLDNEPIDRPGKSIWRGIARAMRRRHNPLTMTTWPIAFWGTAWSVIGLAVLQSSLLLDGPGWLNQTLLASYFIGWISIVWVFFGSRRDALNPVEYGSLAIHLGMFFASIPVVCTQLWIHDGDVLYVFPPLGALLGLTVFIHGLNY